MRRFLVVAVLSLLVGVVAGGTILAGPVAQAAEKILQVQVTNTSAEPVPVREQLPSGPTFFDATGNHAGGNTTCTASTSVVPASTLVLSAFSYPKFFTIGASSVGCNTNTFDGAVMRFTVAANETVSISLPATFAVNKVLAECWQVTDPCGPNGESFEVIGAA